MAYVTTRMSGYDVVGPQTFGDVWDDIAKGIQVVGATVGAIRGSQVKTPAVATPPVTAPGLFSPGGFIEKNQTVLLLAAAGLAAFFVLGKRRG
jgi:hypothetical protein